MKKIRNLVAAALIFTSSVSIMGCSNINTTANSNIKTQTVLATIGKEKITLADVDNELSQLIESLKADYGKNFETSEDTQALEYLNSQRISVLYQLIQEKILLTKAEELDLVPDEETLKEKINAYIADLTESYGGEEELENAKEYYGYTDETFNEFVKNQVIQELVVEEITKDVTVSEGEIEDFYNENLETYFTQKPGAKAKHILFETEEDAKKVKNSIDKGETTFEDEFNKYNNNESRDDRPVAEDLGFVEFEQEGFDKDFLKGFKNVEENVVTKPIKSSFGYHLVLATEISKEDVITPLEDVKDSIMSQLEYDKQYTLFQNQLIKWEEELNVKITAESIGLSLEEPTEEVTEENSNEVEESSTEENDNTDNNEDSEEVAE